MAATELLAGGILVIASVFALVIARPRDGEVRSFLRNDHVQAYYTIAALGALVFGVINLIVGINDMMD
jgi:hypothetical protein